MAPSFLSVAAAVSAISARIPLVFLPPPFSSAAGDVSAISARVPLSLPSSTKDRAMTVGGGGGWRMTLTLFDFEGEQITQITSHLLDHHLNAAVVAAVNE